MLKKRGFGALIITVLAFSLLMAIGVTVVTKLLAGQFKSEAKCQGVSVQFEKIKHKGEFSPDVCYSAGLTTADVSIKIRNTGKENLKGATINLAGTKGIQKSQMDEKIKPGASIEKNIKYDKIKHGDLKKAVVVPLVGRKKIECYGDIASTENIGIC